MADDKGKLIEELRQRMQKVTPLPDEKDFHTSTETLTRFLKARDWKIEDSEKLLKGAIEWRREYRPLVTDCTWCHDRPGYHCLRQVGFDEIGRPVVYSCFSQAATRKPTAEDSVRHVTYSIENAKRTMQPGITSWVFIIDCTGMTLSACNPKLGYGVTQIMSNHYPERLGMVICLNHNPVFQGVWNAIKVFLHPNTVAKMQLVRSKKKIKELFSKYFSEELCEWLSNEIKLNKQRPMLKAQREFWSKPEEAGAHDPRGCPSYVANYIDPYIDASKKKDAALTLHKPHPNMIDKLQGSLKNVKNSSPDAEKERLEAAMALEEFDGEDYDSDVEDNSFNGKVPEFKISDEYQIPKTAKPIQYM